MSASRAMVRRWRVGGYVVEMSMSSPAPDTVIQLVCEWSPCIPSNLTRAELRAYVRGRDTAVASLTNEMVAEANRQRLVLDPDPCEVASAGTPLQ